MNVPPKDGIRVAAEDLRRLVCAIYEAVPLPAEHARLIADLLVDTELRGVVSHGVMQVERYVRSFQEGRANPDPTIRVLHEGPATAALSGDGGLGMIVATRAMRMAVAKAKESGVGVVTTVYHHHLGSSGKYVRMALKEDLVGISLSGRNAAPSYNRADSIRGSIQGSPPLAFGMPAGTGRPNFLLDYASHFVAADEDVRRNPAVFVKAIGMSHVANILSGTLGGQMLPEFDRRTTRFQGADQSGFHMALDVSRFTSRDALKADMDYLMDETAKMQPLSGLSDAGLPGQRAWKKEADYRENGIPVSAEAVRSLGGLAREFSLPVPWA
ncbi:MAG: Ldh family oxidoreductase [Gemmatimonadota bacterium]|nr:Ldh family oxidoreductase [Gemmatimonadota bacterium]